MAKQDALDAINATIVENNQKGITAPSLKNVLITMVENAGEGGGSGEGALRIIVPDLIMLGPQIIAMGELSPTTWSELKASFNVEAGELIDLSEYDAAVNMSFAHNASVAQQILAKARAGQGVSVVLDSTPYTSAVSAFLNAQSPGMIEAAIMGGVQPAAHIVQYIKPKPDAEELVGGEIFGCILIPAGSISMPDIGVENYPSDMRITLNLDGSLIFEKPEADPEA